MGLWKYSVQGRYERFLIARAAILRTNHQSRNDVRHNLAPILKLEHRLSMTRRR